MSFPLDKYKYYVATKVTGEPYKVIAVSTYAGKTVRGTATCSPEDTFSLQKGKELAAARCNAKIARKRMDHAYIKEVIAKAKVEMAIDEHDRAWRFLDDTQCAYDDAMDELEKLESQM